MEIDRWGMGTDIEVIAEATIANDGTGTWTRGNYVYDLEHKGRGFREGVVEDFPRESLNVWDLLFRILRDAVGERNE